MHRIREWNLFRDPFVVNNAHQLRNQLISTRVFLLCYSVCVVSYCMYLLMARTTIDIAVESPTMEQFGHLLAQYPYTLSCPCSNLSIRHQTFISLKPAFHEMCSEHFESLMETWIRALFDFTQTLTNSRDFRFTAALQMRLIALLCSSVKEVIQARTVDFNATAFTSPLLMSRLQLEQQADKVVDQFIVDATSQFLNSLQMARIAAFGSQVNKVSLNFYCLHPRDSCFFHRLHRVFVRII